MLNSLSDLVINKRTRCLPMKWGCYPGNGKLEAGQREEEGKQCAAKTCPKVKREQGSREKGKGRKV
jgi:hypothetical protein